MTTISPQHQFAIDIVRKLRSVGHVALFAGGCVRDSLLGRDAKDYDVATTARPDEVRTLFGHRKTMAVGASFGVIMVIGSKQTGHVEVATFRTEGPYLDGRRPERVEFCTPEEDAKRRDFTINGMFFDPIEQRVLDFVGGEADLSARLVRAIGDPHERVCEDKLRMLRAVRFTATLGFSLDPTTANAIREMSSELIVVSSERIAQELKKMLVDVNRRRAIELADEVNLIRIILPELDSIRRTDEWTEGLKTLERLEQPCFELALAVLLMSISDVTVTERICRRLKLSNDETERTIWIVAHQRDLDDARQLSLANLKRTLSHPYRDDLLAFQRARRIATSSSLEPVEFCDEFLTQTPPQVLNPLPLITGDDLIALGLKPGPRFKSILVTIRDAQLNLELNTRDEAVAMVEALRSK